MSGMTIDPQKCSNAKIMLVVQGASWSAVIGLGPGGVGLPLAVSLFDLAARRLPWSESSMSRFMYDFTETIRGYLDHCDGGNGLKRRLQQFKAKALEVIAKHLPTSAPAPVPVKVDCMVLDLPATIGGEMMLPEPAPRELLVGYGILTGSMVLGGVLVAAPYALPALPEAVPVLAGAVAL